MTEFARWQWDDVGQWRDFAEQHQAEMEASFQSRAPCLELAIPPFGTFRMDLKRMRQVTLRGRNPGYEREIRRQARRIEAGYFILGHEGEIFASDEAIDQIEDAAPLEALASLLGRIVEDPEDFSRRSANLSEGELADAFGACELAVDFLKERGFEEIEDGDDCFVVFLSEDTSGLSEALREVEARLAAVRRQQAKASSSGNAANPACSESGGEEDDSPANLVAECSCSSDPPPPPGGAAEAVAGGAAAEGAAESGANGGAEGGRESAPS